MSSKKSLKKKLRAEIIQKLDISLENIKPLLDEKSFNNRLKKAAKMLSDGISGKEIIKKIPLVKKPTGKNKIKADAEPAEEKNTELVAADANDETGSVSKKQAPARKTKAKK